MARIAFLPEYAIEGGVMREQDQSRACVVDDTGRVVAVGHIEASTAAGTAPGTQVAFDLRFVGETVSEPLPADPADGAL